MYIVYSTHSNYIIFGAIVIVEFRIHCIKRLSYDSVDGKCEISFRSESRIRTQISIETIILKSITFDLKKSVQYKWNLSLSALSLSSMSDGDRNILFFCDRRYSRTNVIGLRNIIGFSCLLLCI